MGVARCCKKVNFGIWNLSCSWPLFFEIINLQSDHSNRYLAAIERKFYCIFPKTIYIESSSDDSSDNLTSFSVTSTSVQLNLCA